MVCMKELFNDSKCLLIRSEKDEMSVVETKMMKTKFIHELRKFFILFLCKNKFFIYFHDSLRIFKCHIIISIFVFFLKIFRYFT